MSSNKEDSSAIQRSNSGSARKVVGEWELIKRLGSGSFASVFLACHIRHDKHVAIKAISRSKLTKKLEKNLQKEVHILRDMMHENIVQLYDTQESSKHIYLVMEYCAGGDLHNYLKKHGKLSNSVAQTFMIQLASGMHYLWARNLIHRDLKPQNLLLTEKGPGGVLKIADFGFARHLGAAAMAETMCGSPLYMAPEILDGKYYDSKADLWSAGTILFEMLVGKPPFYGRSPRELYRNIMKKKFRFPVQKYPVSSQCVNLLESLLTSDPAERISFESFNKHPFVNVEKGQELKTTKLATSEHTGGESDSSSSLPGSCSSGSSIFGGENVLFGESSNKESSTASSKVVTKSNEEAWEIVPTSEEQRKGATQQSIAIRFSGEVCKRVVVLGQVAQSIYKNRNVDEIASALKDLTVSWGDDVTVRVFVLSLLVKCTKLLSQVLETCTRVSGDDALVAAAKVKAEEIRDSYDRFLSLSKHIETEIMEQSGEGSSMIDSLEAPSFENLLIGIVLQLGKTAGKYEVIAKDSNSVSILNRALKMLSIGRSLIELLYVENSAKMRGNVHGLNTLYQRRIASLKTLREQIC